jgi:MFS family permease
MIGRLSFGLSRELWLVQAGILLNTLGWGAVLPFEVIYLHDGRGFGLGLAGLVVGTLTGVGIVGAPLAGPVIDRVGARATTAAAGIALAAGYVGLAFAHTTTVAFAAAAVGGVGNGALTPSQSTLLAALAPADRLHRAGAVSRVSTNVGFGFGGAIGGLVASHGLNGFVALFLANAATYLVYVVVLVHVVHVDRRPRERVEGGYRLVLRDRPFVHLAVTNVAVIGVGWGVLPWLVPPFAAGELALGPRLIGLLMLANAATVVVAQVPAARLAEGRRRATAMALGSTTFVAACVLIWSAGAAPDAAAELLVAAAVAFGVGECLHTTALIPLVAELAPAAVRGRYMASIGLSWWVALALAPTVGVRGLAAAGGGVFLGAGAVAAAAAVSFVALEPRLPEDVRLTPRLAAPAARPVALPPVANVRREP